MCDNVVFIKAGTSVYALMFKSGETQTPSFQKFLCAYKLHSLSPRDQQL